MRRRMFLISAGLLASCGMAYEAWFGRKRKPVAVGVSAEPTLLDPLDRVTRKLEIAMNGDGVGFDPFTLSILASVICSVLRYCMANNATRIQRAIQRRPEGSQAVRMRGKLTTHFAQARLSEQVLLFPAIGDVKKHVDATMLALVRATPEEFRQLVVDVQADPPPENAVSCRAANEWSAIE
ncbi:MAG: hypothetical protein WCH39_10275 [Schlesneria sp.]